MHRDNASTRFGECESNSAPRFDNARLLKARFINLAQKNFEILNLKGGALPKTLHASPIKFLMISLGSNQARLFRKYKSGVGWSN